MADNVVSLIWRQPWKEVVLYCLNQDCRDVCIYPLPETMSPSRVPCEVCGKKKMTDKIPYADYYGGE